MVSCGQYKNAVNAQSFLKEEYFINVSTQSIRRALKRNGLHSRVCRKKPLLRKIHRQNRLAFAKKYKNWTVEDWKKVIWSDESKFNVFGSDGRQYCWKKLKEPLRSHHVKPTVKHGGGSIMVWGCITSQGVGFMCQIEDGLNAELYRSILSDEYLKTLEWYDLSKTQTIFQHDNDPKHTATSTKTWLQENEISVLKWPSQSPDLNPIEHLWNELDRRIRKRQTLPNNRAELWEMLEEEWNNIEPDFCLKLIKSMPKRVKDVLKAKGGYTTW